MKRYVLILALFLTVAAIGVADMLEWRTDLDAALEAGYLQGGSANYIGRLKAAISEFEG